MQVSNFFVQGFFEKCASYGLPEDVSVMLFDLWLRKQAADGKERKKKKEGAPFVPVAPPPVTAPVSSPTPEPKPIKDPKPKPKKIQNQSPVPKPVPLAPPIAPEPIPVAENKGSSGKRLK